MFSYNSPPYTLRADFDAQCLNFWARNMRATNENHQ